MKYDINRWIFEIPSTDIINENYPDSEPQKSCFCCGGSIKQNKYFVHLLTNGNIVSSDEDFDNSQGYFHIGSCCKNKVPNNFIFKSTYHEPGCN